jgi:Mn-containing catalase
MLVVLRCSISISLSGSSSSAEVSRSTRSSIEPTSFSARSFPETREHEERGLHRTLYRFSPDDYRDIDKIWKGPHPSDGQEVEVADGPPEGAPRPDLPEQPGIGVPGYDPGELAEIAKRLMKTG